MLKVRIIPCLDVKDGRVVKGVQFKAERPILEEVRAGHSSARHLNDRP
jgi:imidazole glycerol phosphate synthase subunit HisF